MAKNKDNYYVKLANRIYDLDQKALDATGSSLGRVFSGEREKNIKDIVLNITADKQSYTFRAELAAIANMIRTIPEKKTKSALLREYNDILMDIKKKGSGFNSVEIINEQVAGLNATNFSSGKRSKDDHLIICISRSHSSAGSDIGFALADNLKINFYDTDVLKNVMTRMNQEKDLEWLEEKDAVFLRHADRVRKSKSGHLREFSRFHGLPSADAEFFNISKFLCEIAHTEDFVVVGRCADAILANNHIPHVSIYITAPADIRARHLMQTEQISSFRKAMKIIAKTDAKHEAYYHRYTGRIWGYAGNYDLCLNSSSYGIEESVEVIKRIIKDPQD